MSQVCAGCVINPGDVVVAGDDGVCIVAREKAADALEKSRERMAKEEITRQRLAAGEAGLDIYNMREKLAAAGMEYVD